MAMSRALGGPELTPLEQIEVLEALSAADGSAGWCGMINSDGGYGTSFSTLLWPGIFILPRTWRRRLSGIRLAVRTPMATIAS